MAVSDIVLERPLPPELQNDPESYAACIGGAILREEYLRLLGEAGLTEIRVTREVDAGPMLQDYPGPVSDELRSCCSPSALSGLISSIHVAARRPAEFRS